uniref:Translation initiation factor eIF2B subunit beta n=1 Tax=Ciona savignyi TaxID=51511 RepID=H2Z4M9_CIOSA
MEQFLLDLKQEKFNGSYDLAYKTINHLRKVISQTRWAHAQELMNTIRKVGKQIVAAQPSEYVVGNIVRRVLKIIREEYVRLLGESEESANKESLHQMFTPGDYEMEASIHNISAQVYYSYLIFCDDSVKHLVFLTLVVTCKLNLENLKKLYIDLKANAIEHIHSNEVILTLGKSRTVEAFLKQAAKKRKFHVIVVEGAPLYHGHELAKSLASKGIETTVITDTAIFAIMSRVNKVIIGTHSVLANGGLKAVNGAHMVALAAAHHAVPLIVLGAMFKLCLLHHSDIGGSEATFNRLASPQEVLGYYDAGSEEMTGVQIYNPTFDYVPPELVTLFISNIGGNAPSYMYRLLSELYHPDDHVL